MYDFWQGPKEVRSENDARRGGLNCIALAHLALKHLFDRSLPPQMHCYEMFSNDQEFSTLDTPDMMQIGDLVWFGLARPKVSIEGFRADYDKEGQLLNWRYCPVKHVAIYTGQQTENDYLLLHATPFEGTNAIWPLQQFASHKRYEHIYRISRLLLEPSLPH